MAYTSKIALCIQAAGSHVGGVLLYRIAWYSRLAKIKTADGRSWVVNSAEKWIEEAVCSPKQLKTEWANLKKRGLIESEKHLFQGRIHAFVQLTPKSLQVLIGESLQGPMDKSPQGPIYNKGVLKGSSEGSPSPASGDIEPGELLNAEDDVKGLKSVHDLEEASALLHNPDKKVTLEIHWKQRMKPYLAGTFIELSVKEKGQLHKFAKQCPNGSARKVIDFALKNWVAFAKEVQGMAGLSYDAAGKMVGVKEIPTTPAPWFLLLYRQQAVTLWLKSTAKKQEAPLAACVPSPVQLNSQPPAPPEPDEPKMTLAEFWADPEEGE